MSERLANDDMLKGYRDGRDVNAPEPSANRSRSYRHGFANGRRDIGQSPELNAGISVDEMRRRADQAMEADEHA